MPDRRINELPAGTLALTDVIAKDPPVGGTSFKQTLTDVDTLLVQGQKNQNNGIAGLDGTGRVATSVLPQDLAATATPTFASVQAAHNASPSFDIRNVGGAPDNQLYKIGAGPSDIYLRLYNDAGTASFDAWTITRSANSVVLNSINTDLTVTGDVTVAGGHLKLNETTTPTAVANVAQVYAKTDNTLYFQDGAGAEKAVKTGASDVDSIFGRSGTVVAVSGDYNTSLVTENTNLYFTNARALTSVGKTNNASGFSISGGTLAKTLILTEDVTLNQELSTTGTPTFNTLTVNSTTDRITIQPMGGTSASIKLLNASSELQILNNADAVIAIFNVNKLVTVSGDLAVEGGHIRLNETTTPTAIANVAQVYAKTDNQLYFQDGAGVEKIVSTDATNVSSVFGRSGAVVAVSGDYNTSLVTENTNLYFTNARALTGVGKTNNATGFSLAGGTTSKTLTLTEDVTLNQELSTAGTPTFNTLTVNSTTDRLTIQPIGGTSASIKILNASSNLQILNNADEIIALFEVSKLVTVFDDLLVTGGHLRLNETTTPTAVANVAQVYAKTDNNLYFQDGAGAEKVVSTGATNVSSIFGRSGAVVAVSGDYNTSLVTENTNLYFTNPRALTAVQKTNNATGFSVSGGTLAKTLILTEDSTIDQELSTTGTPKFNTLTVNSTTDRLTMQPIGGTSGAIKILNASSSLQILNNADAVIATFDVGKVVTLADDLVVEGGHLRLNESTTPTAIANVAQVYAKTDNNLYFQDGAGAEKVVSTGATNVSSVFGRSGAVVAVSGDYNTLLVTENTNLYFTNARALTGVGKTNNATGFSLAGGTTSKTLTLTEDSTIDQELSTAGTPKFNTLTVNSTTDRLTMQPIGGTSGAIKILNASSNLQILNNADEIIALFEVSKLVTVFDDLVVEGGHLRLNETTTPTAVSGKGQLYTKTDNNLYFQDGAGAEKQFLVADQSLNTTSNVTFANATVNTASVTTVSSKSGAPLAFNTVDSAQPMSFKFAGTERLELTNTQMSLFNLRVTANKIASTSGEIAVAPIVVGPAVRGIFRFLDAEVKYEFTLGSVNSRKWRTAVTTSNFFFTTDDDNESGGGQEIWSIKRNGVDVVNVIYMSDVATLVKANKQLVIGGITPASASVSLDLASNTQMLKLSTPTTAQITTMTNVAGQIGYNSSDNYFVGAYGTNTRAFLYQNEYESFVSQTATANPETTYIRMTGVCAITLPTIVSKKPMKTSIVIRNRDNTNSSTIHGQGSNFIDGHDNITLGPNETRILFVVGTVTYDSIIISTTATP